MTARLNPDLRDDLSQCVLQADLEDRLCSTTADLSEVEDQYNAGCLSLNDYVWECGRLGAELHRLEKWINACPKPLK